MKIVLLDIDTVTTGDVSLEPLTALGEVRSYRRLLPEETAAAIGDAQAVVCNKTVIDAAVMDACPQLRLIALFATGYNTIDIAAAAARGITVCNAPGYSTDAVAQHTFSLILALAGNLLEYDRSVHDGDWIRAAQFTYFPYPLAELAGKTLGVFGYGAIGSRVAAIGRAFGMEILVTTRTPARCAESCVPAEALFRRADVLTFHCPLSQETRALIRRESLALMKPGALLINTARGGIMNEQDVADALVGGVIAGAGIDVLAEEPMRPDNPLLHAPHCILTPHIAWAPRETRARLVDMVADNLIAYQNGRPQHVIRP